MNKIFLYFHGGSHNHGCEAIVRTTHKLLGQELALYTSDIKADQAYQIDELTELREDSYVPLKRYSVKWFILLFTIN